MIKSSQRLYSQQRLTVSNWRRLESSSCFDMDSVLRGLITGTSTGYIVAGMKLNINSAAFSAVASNLTLNSQNSTLLHSTASESGTILNITGSAAEILNATNTKVIGSFAAGSTNYVCLDLARVVDETSTENVTFWDADNSTEFSKVLPVSTILDYRIIINQTGFGAYLPIATVVTNSSNIATSITDCRQLLFRLGTGGTTPNPNYSFPWSAGRTETSPTTTSSAVNPFTGADKDIATLKEWIDAVETSLKEVKGTSRWYQIGTGSGSTTDLSLFSVAEDANLSYMTAEGTVTHSASVTGQLQWTGDLYIRNAIDSAYYKIQANPSGTTIPNSGVLAVSLTRYQILAANVTIAPSLASQPAAVQAAASSVTTRVIVGNPGDLSVLTGNLATDNGDFIKVNSDSPKYYTQISNFYDVVGGVTSSTLASYAVLASAYGGSIGSQTIQWQQTYYPTANLIVTAKANVLDVSNLSGLRWIAARNDLLTRSVIYLKEFGELQQGESRQVNDETSDNILQFVGAVTGSYANESLTIPLYASAVTGGITSPSQVNYPGASTDDLTVRASKLSSAAANKTQDRNIALVGGGDLTNSSGSIQWSQTATLIIGGPGAGVINTIPAATANIPASASYGGCAYVTFNRNTSVTLTVSVTTNDLLPLAENVLVIARRAPSDTNVYAGIDGQAMYLADGSSNGTGFNPATATTLGVGNLHRWNASIPVVVTTTATLTYSPYTQAAGTYQSHNLYSTASLMVFRNGTLEQGGTDYTVNMSGSPALQVTFPSVTVGDEIFFVWPSGKTVPYSYVQETFTQSVTSNTDFTLSQVPGNKYGVQVFLNGLQRDYIHMIGSPGYGEFSVSGSTVSFTTAPDYGSVVTAYYTSANDNIYANQSRLDYPLSPNGAITNFKYYETMLNLRSAIITVNGVAQNSVQTALSITSGLIEDCVWVAPDTLNFSLTGWVGASVPTGAVVHIWSR